MQRVLDVDTTYLLENGGKESEHLLTAHVQSGQTSSQQRSKVAPANTNNKVQPNKNKAHFVDFLATTFSS